MKKILILLSAISVCLLGGLLVVSRMEVYSLKNDANVATEVHIAEIELLKAENERLNVELELMCNETETLYLEIEGLSSEFLSKLSTKDDKIASLERLIGSNVHLLDIEFSEQMRQASGATYDMVGLYSEYAQRWKDLGDDYLEFIKLHLKDEEEIQLFEQVCELREEYYERYNDLKLLIWGIDFDTNNFVLANGSIAVVRLSTIYYESMRDYALSLEWVYTWLEYFSHL